MLLIALALGVVCVDERRLRTRIYEKINGCLGGPIVVAWKNERGRRVALVQAGDSAPRVQHWKRPLVRPDPKVGEL